MVVYGVLFVGVPVLIAFAVWKFWLRDFVGKQRQANELRRELAGTRARYDEVVQLGTQDVGLDDEEIDLLFGRIMTKVGLTDEVERRRAYEVVETLYHDEGFGSLPILDWTNIELADRALLHSDLEYRKRLWRTNRNFPSARCLRLAATDAFMRYAVNRSPSQLSIGALPTLGRHFLSERCLVGRQFGQSVPATPSRRGP